jgi:hypothetical protein
MSPGLAYSLIVLTHARMGNKDKAREVLDELVQQSKQKYVSPFILACAHFAIGDDEEGFLLLRKAVDEDDVWLAAVKILLELEPVRSDPRYIAILKKMNLED